VLLVVAVTEGNEKMKIVNVGRIVVGGGSRER
jgi:hypothetical protein